MRLEPLYVVDAGPFDAFHRREYPGLHAVAAALGGTEVANDLVQDTMLRALVQWRRVSFLDRPGGWCHRVLLNVCRSWYRRRRTEVRHWSRQRAVEPVVGGPSAHTVAFCGAVRRLPARLRSAVVLLSIGDRPVAEVASILGVPGGTVRSHLSRAQVAMGAELGL